MRTHRETRHRWEGFCDGIFLFLVDIAWLQGVVCGAQCSVAATSFDVSEAM